MDFASSLEKQSGFAPIQIKGELLKELKHEDLIDELSENAKKHIEKFKKDNKNNNK